MPVLVLVAVAILKAGRERRASKEARRQAAALLLVMLLRACLYSALRSPRNGATQRRHANHAVTAVVAAERTSLLRTAGCISSSLNGLARGTYAIIKGGLRHCEPLEPPAGNSLLSGYLRPRVFTS